MASFIAINVPQPEDMEDIFGGEAQTEVLVDEITPPQSEEPDDAAGTFSSGKAKESTAFKAKATKSAKVRSSITFVHLISAWRAFHLISTKSHTDSEDSQSSSYFTQEWC